MKKFYFILLLFPFLSQANEGIQFFEKKIRPALEKYCYRCHSDRDNKIRGGLLVDTQSGLLKGGDSGPAIVPGSLRDSILWSSITYEDFEMPPKEPMPKSVIEDFRKWILMGAPDPRKKENIIVKTTVTAEDIKKGKSHWSYQIPKYQAPKKVENDKWSQSKIDQYIYKGLTDKKLKPAPAANAKDLIRRVNYDLIGLAPSPSKTASFEKAFQKNPDKAVEKLVDQLLSMRQFGERWARHWLDIARYADSTGKDLNATYPTAWRYRDYVINSFNKDKPFDQFLQEQIAGDLIKPKDDYDWGENIIATGFLTLGAKSLREEDERLFQADLIDEQIDVVSRGILGVSVACARCHDHKFEAIPQKDYYALAGIFRSSKTHYGTVPMNHNRYPTNLLRLPRVYNTKGSSSEREELRRQLEDINAELDELKEQRRASRNDPNGRNRRVGQTNNALVKKHTIEQAYAVYESDGTKRSLCMGMQPGKNQDAVIFERGEVSRPGQTTPRGVIQVLDTQGLQISRYSSGRKELSYWLSSKKNPLTARVMVNRIWLKLFGEGLVRTPDDFGVTGTKPTNQALLDYLALYFMQNDWSIKALIKEIILSKTYRMSTQFSAKSFKLDPENKLVWRMNPKRLEAEAIRDSILLISGKLNLMKSPINIVEKVGEIVIEIDGSRGRDDKYAKYDPNTPVRSIYLPQVRDGLPSFLKSFDMTDSYTVTSQREVNNTAKQALLMMNDEFMLSQSDSLAKKLLKQSSDINNCIKEAFKRCYGRAATHGEFTAATSFYFDSLTHSDLKNKSNEERKIFALSAICQAIFASAEFRYLK